MKDYYAVLGVLPSIEQSALKAVYAALMKKYHPDVTTMPKNEAELRAKEINEAYSVLGDTAKRAEYDAQRKQSSSQSGDYSQESSSASSADNLDPQFQNDWKFVISHFPSAEKSRLRLRKISIPLSEFYQVLIIGGKMARQSSQLASNLEKEFLTHYFGSNAKMHKFVVFLIQSDRKEALLEINNFIRIIGTPSDIESDKLIRGLIKNYKIQNFRVSDSEANMISGWVVFGMMMPFILLLLFWSSTR